MDVRASNESVLSLDTDHGIYQQNDSNSANSICLSDLTAPRPCYSCIKLKCFRCQFRPVYSHGSTKSVGGAYGNHIQDALTECSREENSDSLKNHLDPKEYQTEKHSSPSHDKTQAVEENKFSTSLRFSSCFEFEQFKCVLIKSLWSLLTSSLVIFGLSAFIECGSQTYVNEVSLNNTEIVAVINAPSFVSQLVTACSLVVYPVYLIVCSRKQFQTGLTKDHIMNHLLILTSEQPTTLKILARCTLLALLWQAFLNCCLRSLKDVSPIDCASILSVYPCFLYLLCWIVVHRRFSALRVIAFILASSGVILNIYSDQRLMWSKGLISMSLVSYSVYTVILKRVVSRPTFGQFAAFYFLFGLFNLVTFWPISVFLSILTSVEPIRWGAVPWITFCSVGVFLFIFIFANFLSNRWVPRAIRAIQPLGTPVALIVYHLFWNKCDQVLKDIRIGSFVLIALACILNALPNKWLKAVAKLIRKHRANRNQQQASKRNKAASTVSSIGGQATGTAANQRASLFVLNPGSRPGSASSSGLQQNDGKSKTRSRFGSVLLRSPPMGSGVPV